MNTAPPPPREDPFLQRVLLVIHEWVEDEWRAREAIRNEAAALGWNAERAARYRDCILTTTTLSLRIDGMSEATFRRELAKVGAATPGELIRRARLAFAAKLLVETRLRVTQVAKRAGYASQKHFSAAFSAEHGLTPSEYRRNFINQPHEGETRS